MQVSLARRIAWLCTGLVAALLPIAPALAAPDATWSLVPSPNGAGTDNALGSLAVVSAQDIWAVGNSAQGSSRLTLIEHWNGVAWSVVPSPNGALASDFLTGVAAVSAADVWAVGYTTDGSQSRTLIEHWNGSAWSLVASPNTRAMNNMLYSVAAVSASDIWAVGQRTTYSQGGSLILHWNGSAWAVVSSPSPGRYANPLYSVVAVTANDVWAVGTHSNSLDQTLVEHWNGSQWSVVSSPNIGPYGNNLLRVSATAANDVWAVGYHLAVFGVDQVYQTSMLHWNGAAWQIVSTPNENQHSNYLYSVVGLAVNDAWAVGFYDTGQFQYLTLIQHWDGAQWSIVSSPNANQVINELYDVRAVSAADVWSVGTTFNGFGYDTLVAHYH